MAYKLHTKESLDLFNTVERVRLAAGNNQFTIELCSDLARLCAMIPSLQNELEMTQKREHAAIRWGNRMKADLDAEIIRLEGQRDTMTSAMLAAEETLKMTRATLETLREQLKADEKAAYGLRCIMHDVAEYFGISTSLWPAAIAKQLKQMKDDKDDVEIKWEELCKAIGAHGPESDPLTGCDTNDEIHKRAMERIGEMTSDEF
jgi:hypothetical protein